MNPMGRLHHETNGVEVQSHRSQRHRPEASSGTSSDENVPSERRGLLHSLSMARLRRPGGLQRAASTIAQSEVASRIAREARFMDGLLLKAPYVPEEVCSGCGNAECECEPESDDEEEEEELPKNSLEQTIHDIRLKTDVVRDYSGRIVNDQCFQIFIVILILLNSLFIGLATFDFVENNENAYRAFRILDLAFLIIFTIELIMQFLYHGYGLFFDGWLMFDLFIVITSWTLESVSVLRALKLRSFRIFRAFRLTTKIRALRRLVEAIFDVLPRISAIICMFCLIIYIFGVMCTELFGEIDFTDRFQDPQAGTYSYFGRLDDALFTLFAMVTLDWARVTRAVMQVYPWASYLFSTYVTFSSFILYNLIIAVVCDAVKMVQDQQDILMVENYVKDKVESRHRIINLRKKLDKMSKQQMDLLLYVQLLLEQVDEVGEASKLHYEEALLQLSQTNTNARDSLKQALKQLDHFEKLAGLDDLTPEIGLKQIRSGMFKLRQSHFGTDKSTITTQNHFQIEEQVPKRQSKSQTDGETPANQGNARVVGRTRARPSRSRSSDNVEKPTGPPQFPRLSERIPRSRRVSFKDTKARSVGESQIEAVAVFADLKEAITNPCEDDTEQIDSSHYRTPFNEGDGLENESFHSCRLLPPEAETVDAIDPHS
ncbi:Sodium channel voltage-gated type [Seminavis robusta]|uniref:Sodium channel voltage-gated type n=1 Tax=Seminavis robusta TaxID=568900 RepID=A0A9N8HL41_9STRA|nr:Sodium channel voltage-gated type [Seminavis robusta]|eukprot:Sro657_g182540.1 Sodium channel voltage-gated type (658) ;mRNA; r:7435-9488